MPRISHLGGLAIVGLLIAAPIGDATVLLLFLLLFELELGILLVQEHGRRPVAAAAPDMAEGNAPLHLLRRTVPHLRARHSFGVVEEQVRWRQRAEAYRRRRIGG